MPSPPLCGKLSWNAPWISRQHTTAPTATPSTALRAPKMVRLQDFGDCSQSSQIGPHLLQPLSTGPMATMLKINARLNFVDHSPFPSCSLKSGRATALSLSAECPLECVRIPAAASNEE